MRRTYDDIPESFTAGSLKKGTIPSALGSMNYCAQSLGVIATSRKVTTNPAATALLREPKQVHG